MRAKWLLCVVICFHFTTFAVLETTVNHLCLTKTLLWFAFILLPLPYWKQLLAIDFKALACCDLLSFYYLCRTGNNAVLCIARYWNVVICFHFTTFAVLETTILRKSTVAILLWFAFILLPLPYWKQRVIVIYADTNCCDLLSFYYLCRTGNNPNLGRIAWPRVVICFHFTTFAVLETTRYNPMRKGIKLWFAFILLPLPYWKQHVQWTRYSEDGCDLLSFYYLSSKKESRPPLSLWLQPSCPFM